MSEVLHCIIMKKVGGLYNIVKLTFIGLSIKFKRCSHMLYKLLNYNISSKGLELGLASSCIGPIKIIGPRSYPQQVVSELG